MSRTGATAEENLAADRFPLQGGARARLRRQSSCRNPARGGVLLLKVAANCPEAGNPGTICRKIRNDAALKNEDAAQLLLLRQIFSSCRKMSRRCGTANEDAASPFAVPQDKRILRQRKRGCGISFQGRDTANLLAVNLLRSRQKNFPMPQGQTILRHRESGCGISFSCAATFSDLPQGGMKMPQDSLKSRHRIRECRILLCGAASQKEVAAQDFGMRQFLFRLRQIVPRDGVSSGRFRWTGTDWHCLGRIEVIEFKTMPQRFVQPPPARRPLKIFAFDPMLGRMPLNRITIDVPNEPLQRGPQGTRIKVIDYDGALDCFYEPVDLDHPAILMQGGLDPSESDPRFHQQMVYAVAMKVLENFESALGRKLSFRQGPLRIFPHAFQGENAFFDPYLHALLFGYFRADRRRPGPNLPGQTVFSCLSHDIIAHEMTHALVHRLREHFFQPTNRDVPAFHEGFSDLVAIFQHFTFPEILRDHIQRTRGDLRKSDELVDLAAQFGYATGGGDALRTAVREPDPRLYETVLEPHDRGSLLVAAVFDAFFSTYQRRIADLVRIATGGTGRLPEGDLHPDLVNRIAREASRAAQRILTMCIRAFEYLPPVDITFGDYLRAMVTADFELAPADEDGRRGAMIEAFRARGIYPEGVVSLAEEALLFESPDLPPFPTDLLGPPGPFALRL